VIDQLAADLRTAHPDMRGLSGRSLRYMAALASRRQRSRVGKMQMEPHMLVTSRKEIAPAIGQLGHQQQAPPALDDGLCALVAAALTPQPTKDEQALAHF
jgi:hypothetical protein